MKSPTGHGCWLVMLEDGILGAEQSKGSCVLQHTSLIFIGLNRLSERLTLINLVYSSNSSYGKQVYKPISSKRCLKAVAEGQLCGDSSTWIYLTVYKWIIDIK